MKKQGFLTLLSIWFLLSGITAQDFPRKLKLYSVEDGLSQSSVQSLDRDVFGLIWISTGDGLNSFDGKEFKKFHPPASLTSSVSINRFRRVVSDKTGNLWVGTDEGMLYFNRITNKLEIPFPELTQLKKGYCYPIFTDGDSIHAILVDSTIISIHIKKHTYRITRLGTLIYHLNYSPYEAGELWGLSWPSNLWRFNFSTGKLRIQKYTIESLRDFSDIQKIEGSNYLLAYSHRLVLFDSRTGKITGEPETSIPREYKDGYFRTICRLRSGEVWIGTVNQGILILDPGLKFRNSICNPRDHNGSLEPLSNISNLYEDPTGNIWIGTDGSGLGLINPDKFSFKKFSKETIANGSLSSNFIRCFQEDADGSLWIGTYNEGINKWNRKTNAVEKYLLEKNKAYPSANDIYAVCPFEPPWLIFGTCKGCWLFNTHSAKSYPISGVFYENAARKSTQIIRVNENSLMTIINNKVFRMDHRQDSWIIDTLNLPDSVNINFLYKNPKASVYGFSVHGIYDLTGKVISFKPFLYKDKFVKLQVNSVQELSDGRLWAGTHKGLILFSLTGKILAIYSTENGLPNQYLYGVMADRQNNLWISSNSGLSRFEPQTGKFFNFGMDDGLQSLEFNSGASYKNAKGEMFFGGISGLNYFHPDSLFHSIKSPDIIISGIKVNDLVFLPDSSTMSKKVLYLDYDQNTVTFEFNTIEYIHPGFTSYSYVLKGFDKRWIQPGSINQARYAKLPPGTYVFMVKAANRQGIWSRQPASITLVIFRPFWMKTWFRVLVILVIIGIVAGIVYYLSTVRIKRRLAFLERQQEINLIRRRISSDLHDEIGSGLSKLAMMSDTALAGSTDNPEVEQKLKKLSFSARRLIDQLRAIVWTLNPQYDQLESMIGYIHQHAGDFLDNFPIRSQFFLPEDFPSVSVTPEVKRNIHYAVMEALHNAVKHSGSPDIIVEISIHDRKLKIEITDHGKGIQTKTEPADRFGNGLVFMRNRIEDIGGKLSIESSKETGTRVHIEVVLK